MISHKRLLAAVALAAFCTTTCPGIAAAAEPRNLGEARNHYEFAEFNQALEICNELITAGSVTGNDLRDVYVLKARCLVNVGNHSMAQESFCSALKLDRNWRPAPDLLTKDEQADFDLALAGCALAAAPAPSPAKPAPVISPAVTAPPAAVGGKPWYKKPLFLVLGGAVLIGGAVALAGGGSSGGGGSTPAGPLPGFPNPPTR